ncbi:MAG: hypothetical protein ABIG84_00565 [archaeon]
MDKVKNAGIVIFSSGVVVLLGYFFYNFIAGFMGAEVPIVIKAGVGLVFFGLLVIIVQLVRERMRDSVEDEKLLSKN